MKKFLLVFILAQFSTQLLLSQNLNYSDYVISFYDEFDYPSVTSGVCPLTSAGTTQGTSFSANWLVDNYIWNGALYVPTFVQLATAGSLTTLRLFEDGTGLSMPLSGGVRSQTYLAEYGIIEVRAKFPQNSGHGPGSYPKSAFWVMGRGSYDTAAHGTEIDVFDVSTFDYLLHNVIDWNIHNGTGGAWGEGCRPDFPISTSSGLCNDLSLDFHTYSAVWDASNVSFYVDSIFQCNISYEQVRTYQWGDNGPWGYLQLNIMPEVGSYEGGFLDIDWVKVWKPKCNNTDHLINCWDTSCNFDGFVYPLFLGGLHKNHSITVNQPVGSPVPIPSVAQSEAVILEADFTLIQPNFIADQTNRTTTDIHWTASGMSFSATRITNGYFEVIPIKCEDNEGGLLRTSNNKTHGSSNENLYLSSNDQEESPQVNISPNPTQSTVTITYPCQTSGQLQIGIKDIDGRIRYTQSISCDEGSIVNYTVDMSNYTPGIYFIDLTLNDWHTIKKIVKL